MCFRFVKVVRLWKQNAETFVLAWKQKKEGRTKPRYIEIQSIDYLTQCCNTWSKNGG